MNKIFNWTFGSFFRTIGRTIALLVLGGLFYYILSSNGIGIKDLFFDKVNASTFVNGVEVQYYKEEALTNRWQSNNWYDYATLQSSTSLQGFNQVDFYPSPQINISDIKKGYIEFTYYMSLPIVGNLTTSTVYAQDYCNRWNWGSIDSYNNVIRWDCDRVSQGQDSTITDKEYIHPVVNINAVIIYNNGYADYCSMDTANQKFICPISNYASLSSIKFIRFSQNVYFSASNQYTYYFGIMRRVNKYADSSSSIIDNQNQNTQSIIQSQNETQQAIQESANQTQESIQNATNETIATITDTTSPDINGTLDNDTVAGWLPAGPLDSLLNLPLTLFNSLTRALGGTCADLVVPLPFVNKNLNIPCMSGIYSSMGFGSFFNWIGVIASAFILFSYLMKLYKWVDDTLTFRENNHLDNWGGV